MSRILIFSVCISALFSPSLYAQIKTPSQAAEIFPFLAEVVKEKVNVRAGESENFEKLDTLKKGDQVIVLGKSYSWYKIQLPKTAQSFIVDKYITLLKDDLAEVNADRVNVRAGSDINRTVLGQLQKGSQVRILEKMEGWVRIEPIEKSYGWVLDEFLVFKSKEIPLKNFSQEIKIENQIVAAATAELTDQNVISVTGILEITESNSGENRYHLVVDGKTTYTIQGLEHILKEFLHSKVHIEGKITGGSQNPTSPSVIEVSKIQLVL